MPGTTEHEQRASARRFRSTRLWYAVIWSVVSKAVGSGVQILGIPLAIHALGVEGYATYAALVALCALPAVFAIRYGPDITAEASHAFENGDIEKVRRFLWSTSTTSFLVVGILFLSTNVAFLYAPIGGKLEQHFYTALLLLSCSLLTISFATIETIQAACQENYLLSVRSTVSGLVSLVLLIFLLPILPSLLTLIVCLHVVPVITKIINSILFLLRKPDLLPHVQDWKLRLGLNYARRGVSFSIAAGIAAYCCHQLPILLASAYLPVIQAAIVAASIQVILQFHSIVSLITAPLIPAVADSLAKHDIEWTKQSLRRVNAIIVGYGAVACLLHFLFADFIYFRLLGDVTGPDTNFYRYASLYILTISLENYLFLIVCALSSTTLPYSLFVFRSVLTALVCWIAFAANWPPGMYIAQFIFSLVLVCVPLYQQIQHRLASLSRQYRSELVPNYIG